jgi:hypothetical protein
MNLPKSLVNSFRFFIARGENLTHNDYLKLETELNNYLTEKEMENDEVYEASRLPDFEMKVIAEESISSLEQFLEALMNKITDYKCMANVFRLLNAEKEKYYLPHKQRSFTVHNFVRDKLRTLEPQIISPRNKWKNLTEHVTGASIDNYRSEQKSYRQIKDNIYLVGETCKYITSVYKHCIKALRTINRANYMCWNERVAKLKSINATITNLLKINLFDTNHRSNTLNQIFFDIVPMNAIVLNRILQKNDALLYTEVLSYLFMVMTELNKYGLRHCQPPSYKYMLINNIESKPNSKQSCEDERNSFLSKMMLVSKSGNENGPQLSMLNNLYNFYETQLKKGFIYKDSILFYWRGETRTFRNIFNNLRDTVMSPSYLYELNDVYYKLILANVFYETNIFISLLRIDQINLSSHLIMYKWLTDSDLLSKDDFPKAFIYLIQQLNSFVRKYFNNAVMHDKFPTFELSEKYYVEMEFKRLGVILDVTESKLSSIVIGMNDKNIKKQMKWIETFKSKFNEIMNSGKYVKQTFLDQFLNKYN